jgi:hypothetical protein
MTPLPVQKLVSLHSNIIAERESLLAQLRKTDEALAAMGFNATMRHYGIHTPTGRVRNKLSLKKTVLQVLAKKSLTKDEILDAVLRAGYTFSTDDPLNSLGVILYGKNPRFKKTNGRFSQ